MKKGRNEDKVKDLDCKVAVITGAASGLGRALALALAGRGCHLAIADLSGEGLRETARLVERKDRRITIHPLDVGDREAVYAFAGQVKNEHGGADLLINNAGVSAGFEIEYLDYGYFEWLMKVNFWGVVYGCKAFLPQLKEKQEAHIVNVSSIFAFAVPPRYAAYSAPKAAVRAFTEALYAEMIIQKIPIHVSCAFPGGMKTNIAQNTEKYTTEYIEKYGYDLTGVPEEKIRESETQGESIKEYFKKKPELAMPEEAAEGIIEGIQNNRPRILVGMGSVEVDELVRKCPDNYLSELPRYLGEEYF